jgi:hypothetical protein
MPNILLKFAAWELLYLLKAKVVYEFEYGGDAVSIVAAKTSKMS